MFIWKFGLKRYIKRPTLRFPCCLFTTVGGHEVTVNILWSCFVSEQVRHWRTQWMNRKHAEETLNLEKRSKPNTNIYAYNEPCLPFLSSCLVTAYRIIFDRCSVRIVFVTGWWDWYQNCRYIFWNGVSQYRWKQTKKEGEEKEYELHDEIMKICGFEVVSLCRRVTLGEWILDQGELQEWV